MTTPRDDIAGLIERLREDIRQLAKQAENVKYAGSGSFVRVHEPAALLKDWGEAATQLDSLLKERDALQARVKELEGERRRYDAEVRSWKIEHDQKLATLRRQTTRLQQERDEAIDLLRKMTDHSIDDALYPFAECFDTARDLIRRLAGPEKEGE